MLSNSMEAERNRSESGWRVVFTIAAAALFCSVLAQSRAWADDPNAVVATVGDRKISEQELDDKVKPQMDQLARKIEQAKADIRRQALESMTDDVLVEQAAKRSNLSVDAYLKKEYSGKNGVTDAAAKKFYDENSGPGSAPFDKVKPRLLELLNRQALLERLKKKEPVKILLQPDRVAVNSNGHPALGGKDAPVTIVEFTDFQCPFCQRTEATLKELHDKYGDKIRLVHMDFPLPFHSHALDAAKAARCANEQDKFWPYRNALFADQSKLGPDDLKATAKKLGLNSTQFNQCFDSGKYVEEIQSDQAAGDKLGVDGTPAFFIDGRYLNGAQPAPKFEAVIDDELANGNGANKQASAR